jgi:hypothetical protein
VLSNPLDLPQAHLRATSQRVDVPFPLDEPWGGICPKNPHRKERSFLWRRPGRVWRSNHTAQITITARHKTTSVHHPAGLTCQPRCQCP